MVPLSVGSLLVQHADKPLEYFISCFVSSSFKSFTSNQSVLHLCFSLASFSLLNQGLKINVDASKLTISKDDSSGMRLIRLEEG